MLVARSVAGLVTRLVTVVIGGKYNKKLNTCNLAAYYYNMGIAYSGRNHT
jgi:hypothetical protein